MIYGFGFVDLRFHVAGYPVLYVFRTTPRPQPMKTASENIANVWMLQI